MYRVLCAAVLCATATTAHAQSGPYVGLSLGYDGAKIKQDGLGETKDGLFYGIVAGYDFNLGPAVVGGEVEFADSTADQHERDVLVAGDDARINAGRDLYFGGRLGLPINPALMVYAKGGFTNAQTTFRYDQGDGWSYKHSKAMHGYRVGAGVQFNRGNSLYRLEYRYSDYGSYDIGQVGTNIDLSRSQIVATAGMSF